MDETFISYSRRNSEFIDRLCESLKSMAIDPWIDKDDIEPASKWQQSILVGIQFCHNFLYAISEDAIASKYCDWELDHALALNKRVIPIVCPGVAFPERARPELRELNWIYFDNFQQGLENLLSVLDSPLSVSFGYRLDSQITIRDSIGSRTFPLYRNQYRIGRNPKGDFSRTGLFFLGDSRVSRQHCTLIRRKNRWCVVDGFIELNASGKPINYKQSANGVVINRIEKLRSLQFRPLIHRDIVRLSPETSFKYEEISPTKSERETEIDDRDTIT